MKLKYSNKIGGFMTWQQYLTEKVLKKCWHEIQTVTKQDKDGEIYTQDICLHCNREFRGNYLLSHRTFTTIQDLHDVYSAVVRDREWLALSNYLFSESRQCKRHFASWLFCLNGKPEDFEAMGKRIAEWHGWRNKSELPDNLFFRKGEVHLALLKELSGPKKR